MNKKITALALISCLLLSLFAVPAKTTQAYSGHTLYDYSSKTVYGDPRDNSAETGLALALVAFVPGLGAYKTVDLMLKVLGGGLAYSSFVDKNKPKNQFTVYKWVYKANKTTSTYWGFYRIDIYNRDTGQKWYGSKKTIGKTGI